MMFSEGIEITCRKLQSIEINDRIRTKWINGSISSLENEHNLNFQSLFSNDRFNDAFSQGNSLTV